MIRSNWLYIAVMFAVSYTIRILPLTLIRKPIKNQFIQSFLYYVPYVTLAVMTFRPSSTPPRVRQLVRWRWWWALRRHGSEPACSRCRWPAAPSSSCWNCSLFTEVTAL